MAASRQSNDQEAPFGYYFELPGADDQLAYPPPGPPLLDNTETNLLQNFFDNPNNLDPTFLTLASDPADGLSSFSNNNINWLENGPTSAMAVSSSKTPFPLGLSLADSSRTLGGARSGLNAPEDVYAAAQVLHNKQTSHPNNVGLHFGGYGNSRSNANGYGYGNAGPATSLPYNFGSQGQGDSTYNRQNLPYGPAEDFSPYNQSLNQESSPYAVPEAPMGELKFGTDDNFRNANYAGPKVESPDKTLAKMGHSGIDFAFKEVAKDFRQTTNTGRKRGKTVGEGDESEENLSDDENGTPPKRRRRGRDTDDGDYNESGSRSANGKSRQDGKGRVQRVSSVKKNTKTSPSGSRQPKENLSEEQKRSNHIQSEQKRRNLIKNGFEDLNNLVPDLRAGGYSKSNMLMETARFIRLLRDGNDELKRQIQALDNG